MKQFMLSLIFLTFCSGFEDVKNPAKVEGLEITATFKGTAIKSGDPVAPHRQVILNAKTTDPKSEIGWLVFGTNNDPDFEPSGSTVALVSAPEGGRIDVYAIAVNEGKLTSFAVFSVVSKGAAPPLPTPPTPVDPIKPPVPVSGVPLVVIIDDPATRTPETALIITSATFRAALGTAKFRLYAVNDPALRASGVEATTTSMVAKNPKNGSELGRSTIPALLVVDDKGGLHLCTPLPKTEADALNLLKPYLGGK